MAKKDGMIQKGEGKYSLKGSCLWGLLWFFILVFIDQLTKMLAQVYFESAGAPQSVPVLGEFIKLCLHYNDGIAFSWMENADMWVKMAIVVGTAVIMTALSVFYFKVDKRRGWLRAALVLIVAGGVGNLIDRLYYQMWLPDIAYGVRDMVDLSGIKFFGGFNFGICNFADFFIVGGAIVLVLAILFFDKDALFPVGKYKIWAKEAEENKAKKQAAEKAPSEKES